MTAKGCLAGCREHRHAEGQRPLLTCMQTPLRAPDLEGLLSEGRLWLPLSWVVCEYQVTAERPLRECEGAGSPAGLQRRSVWWCRPSELAAWNGVFWPGSRFVHAASGFSSGSQNEQASLVGAWSMRPGLWTFLSFDLEL